MVSNNLFHSKQIAYRVKMHSKSQDLVEPVGTRASCTPEAHPVPQKQQKNGRMLPRKGGHSVLSSTEQAEQHICTQHKLRFTHRSTHCLHGACTKAIWMFSTSGRVQVLICAAWTDQEQLGWLVTQTWTNLQSSTLHKKIALSSNYNLPTHCSKHLVRLNI